MARNIVAPWMLLALVAMAPVMGCEAHASFGSGGAQQPTAAPPPPPPPAAAATPAPTPTTPAATAPTPTPPPPVDPPKAAVTMSNGKLSIPGNIVYETGKAIIKPESEPTLNLLKDYMDQNPNFTRIRIEGHTDNVGSKEANLKLSMDRAMAVVEWLAAHGAKKERLLAVGFGDLKPIADNKTEDGKAQNRRTEFHIAEMAGKPYKGRDATAGGSVVPGQAPIAK